MCLVLCYCEKCGQHYDESEEELNNLKNVICIGCGKAGYFKPVPKEYLNNGGWGIKEELEEQFIQNIIKFSPNFDQECWDRREAFEEIQKHNDELLEIAKVKQANIPRCPICQSTNIKKISVLSKAGSVAMFGVFALGKTSKQFHCNHCGADF